MSPITSNGISGNERPASFPKNGVPRTSDAAITAATMMTTMRISEPSSIGARSRPSSGTNSQKAM